MQTAALDNTTINGILHRSSEGKYDMSCVTVVSEAKLDVVETKEDDEDIYDDE